MNLNQFLKEFESNVKADIDVEGDLEMPELIHIYSIINEMIGRIKRDLDEAAGA